MRRPFHESLVSWLCLICFGLGSTVLSGELVLCRHADGSSQIEWGACDPDDSGNCADCEGSSSSDSHSQHPCKDIPVKSDRHVAKSVPSPVPQPTWHPEMVVAILTSVSQVQPPSAGHWPLNPRGRPPDPLAHLKSVILLV